MQVYPSPAPLVFSSVKLQEICHVAFVLVTMTYRKLNFHMRNHKTLFKLESGERKYLFHNVCNREIGIAFTANVRFAIMFS